MSIISKLVGDTGEKIAVKHLKNLGYSIIDRNIKTKFVEIDILAAKNNILYVFEVKTLSRGTKSLKFSHETKNVSKKYNLKENKGFWRKLRDYIFHKENKNVSHRKENLKNISFKNQENDFDRPEKRVNKNKIWKMSSFAEYYLNKNNEFNGSSIGIISVKIVDNENPKIDVILN